MNLKVSAFSLGLSVAGLAPATAHAKDCFILIHGHMSTNASQNVSNIDDFEGASGYNYWRRKPDDLSVIDPSGGFIHNVTQGGNANHAVIRWNASNDSALAYWQPEVLVPVVWQLTQITAGHGDLYDHPNQCAASDTFYVVAHSQGAQVMSYINANAYSGAKFHDQAIQASDVGQLATATKVSVPFSSALSKVRAIITMGAAINGTQGMDILCGGGVQAALAEQVLGRQCVPSMQTYEQYNVSSNSGTKMLKPMYMLGGTGSYPLPRTPSSLILGGEDDGTINLASQMNCKGSATRDLEANLREYLAGTFVTFTCSNAYKRHTNTFNLASINQHHEAEVGYQGDSVARANTGSLAINCGGTKDMSGTIAQCVAEGNIK